MNLGREDAAGPRAGTPLLPDRAEIDRFTNALFRHAARDSFLSIRAFDDAKRRDERPLFVEAVGVDDPNLLERLYRRAAQAAQSEAPAVFAPPIATFNGRSSAKAADIANGLAIIVECDANPDAALNKLASLLGAPTVTVRSGGTWLNPNTKQREDKLHLYWRLREPTSEAEGHELLREANRLAAKLVGADAASTAVVHPMRCPGSWHRKSEPPRLCVIGHGTENEVELRAALKLLREAAGKPEGPSSRDETNPFEEYAEASRMPPTGDLTDIEAALAVIPNDDVDWGRWNEVGMAAWRASNGCAFQAFDAWSQKSSKYDQQATDARWRHYKTSPPNQLGMGSLIHWAREAQPGWRKPSDFVSDARMHSKGARPDGSASVSDNEPAPGGADDGRAVTLDDFRAYMPMHSYIFIPSRELWPASSVNARITPVPLLDADGNAVLDRNRRPKLIRASQWLDQNRAVEQMTWAPGEPDIIEGRLISLGGWIERPGCHTFNLYRPPTIIPGDPLRATPWIDHVNKVYPQDAPHILRWLAHRVQRPDEKINHALVLGGTQGVGKDTMLQPAIHGVGPWNFEEISPQQLLGRFNGFVKSVILRISEARDLGDINRYSFYDHLKAYTASPPDVLRVDEKNIREHAVFNVCGVIITTNHKTDGLFLPGDDRRHYVGWSPLTKDDFPEDYWKKLWDWYDKGGINHVVAYLLDFDLSDFDPKAPPPKTEAWWAIVNSSRAPEDAALADALDKLGNPPVVTLREINSVADTALYEFLQDRRNSRQVPHRLEACGYVPLRNPSAQDGLWKLEGRRQVIYAKASLAPREQHLARQERYRQPE